jgi:hypothetical protein
MPKPDPITSDAKLLTHPRFATTERLKELRDTGVVVVEETRDWDDIDLKEPGYGEDYLGELNDDEKTLFFSLYDANNEMEDRTRTYMGNHIARVGATIRDSDRNKSLQEAVSEAELSFDNDSEAAEYFRLQKLAAMLHATFHFNIGERFKAHEFVLGVRTKGRVYKVDKRY